jgi:phosphate starvation-inducible PhoH-like protein
MAEISQILQLPSQESAIALAGMQEENLTYLAQHTGANLVLRGKEIRVYGEEKFVERALKILRSLSPYWQEGKAISRPDLLTACQALDGGQTEEYQSLQRTILAKTRQGETIRAKTFRQRQYVKAIETHDITFCVGPTWFFLESRCVVKWSISIYLAGSIYFMGEKLPRFQLISIRVFTAL